MEKMKESHSGGGNVGIRNGDTVVTCLDSKEPMGP